MSSKALLLVENDPQLAGSIDLFFSSRGFMTAVAASAGEARSLAVLDRPDVIVIGHQDGLLDARDLGPSLRALLTPREPPIVVVSPVRRHFEAVVAVLPRPCHPRAILDVIRTVLRLRGPRA